MEQICVADIDCSAVPVAVSAAVPVPSVSMACPLSTLYTICCCTTPFPVILPDMSMGVEVGPGGGV